MYPDLNELGWRDECRAVAPSNRATGKLLTAARQDFLRMGEGEFTVSPATLVNAGNDASAELCGGRL